MLFCKFVDAFLSVLDCSLLLFKWVIQRRSLSNNSLKQQ